GSASFCASCLLVPDDRDGKVRQNRKEPPRAAEVWTFVMLMILYESGSILEPTRERFGFWHGFHHMCSVKECRCAGKRPLDRNLRIRRVRRENTRFATGDRSMV